MRTHFVLPALVSTAAARIAGIAAPSQIAAGSEVQITIITENYIQSVLDVSAAFGLSQTVFPDTLGTYISSIYIGPDQSNILTNITHIVTVPSSTPLGPTHLETAITSLYGVSSGPVTTIYSLPITIANTTGPYLISTFDGVNACSSSSPSSSASASASATVSATSAATSSSSSLNQIINSIQAGLTLLINEIVQNNVAAAQAQYNSLSSSFDQVVHLANPSESCPNPGTGHELTEAEAIETIQMIQLTLNEVSLDFTNGDSVAATADSCAASADYFNSGLHEYIFRVG